MTRSMTFSVSKKDAMFKYLAGYSGKTIAGLMGRTPDAVKNLLRKAREGIAARIKNRQSD